MAGKHRLKSAGLWANIKALTRLGKCTINVYKDISKGYCSNVSRQRIN